MSVEVIKDTKRADAMFSFKPRYSSIFIGLYVPLGRIVET